MIFYVCTYIFTPLENLNALKESYISFFHRYAGLFGTVLLAPEGANIMLASADRGLLEEFIVFSETTLHCQQQFKWLTYKTMPFKKIKVKIKKEIISVGDAKVSPKARPIPSMSPHQLREWMQEGKDFTLLDTRNHYEISQGSFAKAVDLGLEVSRDFKPKLLASTYDRSKPLVMFCTGGVRCEKGSIVAHQLGFNKVYQLDGGIINYFKECGQDFFQGSLFVFDDLGSVYEHNVDSNVLNN